MLSKHIKKKDPVNPGVTVFFCRGSYFTLLFKLCFDSENTVIPRLHFKLKFEV